MKQYPAFLIFLILMQFEQTAVAQPISTTAQAAGLPFAEVGPYPQDRKNIYEFFLFSCAYCRAYSRDFHLWGASLPKSISFNKVPIPIPAVGMQGARAWYAAKHAIGEDPQILARFEEATYALIHDNGASAELEQTYRKAAREAGIDTQALDRYWQSTEVKNDLIHARELFEQYHITNTPSLAIGGRFTTHAEYVGGDYALLFRLANGLVSRLMIDGSRSGGRDGE